MKHELSIHAVTPIWTGGIQSQSQKSGKNLLRQTGLIGSLRWWFEALLRGLDIETCHHHERHIVDSKAGIDPEELTCQSCAIFGTTGLQRQFRLHLDVTDYDPPWRSLQICPNGHSHGWYFPKGYIGKLNLAISGFQQSVIPVVALLYFLERFGSLGARTTLGCGQFDIDSHANFSPELFWPLLLQWIETSRQNSVFSEPDEDYDNLPNIQNLTFFKYEFTIPSEITGKSWWRLFDSLTSSSKKQGRYRNCRTTFSLLEKLFDEKGVAPVSAIIKDILRYKTSWQCLSSTDSDFFGTAGNDDAERSKIAIGWAVRQNGSDLWSIRGWFWHPPKLRKDEAAKKSDELLTKLRSDSFWRESLNVHDNDDNLEIIEMNDSAKIIDTLKGLIMGDNQ
ncbi:MAG: type III-B CRISPR module RAMP protein Cmr1 [Candidatus Thorarchaeota archaeon]|nr:type III-B CRISPR module RAMP protein Cmr1 [Candidatus Thorarchaeota archaeon]